MSKCALAKAGGCNPVLWFLAESGEYVCENHKDEADMRARLRGCSPNWQRQIWTNCIGMKMVLVPAGRFLMGTARFHDVSDHFPDERPRHRVRITKPFYLGVCPVTQAEYERVMGSNPSRFKGVPNRPVEQVSWYDSKEFLQRLSSLPEEKAAGRVYRLPTEAQWEYACRAGTTTHWCFGNDPEPLERYAWIDGRETHPVGQKKPNAWGLYDMHGNVWEWCEDWYGPYYVTKHEGISGCIPGCLQVWYGLYVKSPVQDPRGPESGSNRVFRGGGWILGAWFCCSASRGRSAPGDRTHDLGFRVSLMVDR